MFTHFYQLYKRVPRARRKELVTFIYKLKNFCGRGYHVHVSEMLEDCCEDYLWIEVKTDNGWYDEVKQGVIDLCDRYGIPRSNIMVNPDGSIEVSLYTDF
jgi:hypothetical protein